MGWSEDRHVDDPCGWQISPIEKSLINSRKAQKQVSGGMVSTGWTK